MALNKEQFEKLKALNTRFNSSDEMSTVDKTKSVATGFVKGVGDTVKGTQDLGQRVLAGIDPTKDINQIRQQTGIKPLQNADFSASNNYEKGGKALEFVAEMLVPLSKTGTLAKGSKTTFNIADSLVSRASTVPDNLVEGGVKVRDKLINMATKLDDKTKTALTRTPREVFDKIVTQGREAMTDDRIKTPIEYVGESIADGLKLVKQKASEVGSKKSEMIKLPSAFKGDGIKKFRGGLQTFLNSRSFIKNDKGLLKDVVSQFKALGDNPTKGQVDKFIDFVQDGLYAGEKNLTLPVSNKTTGALKSLVRGLNEDLKKQLPNDYRLLNDEYGKLSGLMSELNTKLGKKGGNAGSLVKRLFSPSDARTKELFQELGKITGQDYFRDARLAKFVMESLGDTRVESLLEQIPKNKGQFIDKLFDYAVEKTGIKDPIKAAEKFLEQQSLLTK